MAEHWFSHKYLVQGEWGLPGEQDQSLMMGMKPVSPEARGCIDQSCVHKEGGMVVGQHSTMSATQ